MKNSFRAFILAFLFLSSGYSQIKVSGYVVDIQKAEPIENATVFVHDEYNIAFHPPIQTKTDENGYYEFSNLKPGKYSINAYVLYEADKGTFAFVYQPGEFTLKERDTDNWPHDWHYSLSFAFSKTFFRYRLELDRNPQRAYAGVFSKDTASSARSRALYLRPQVLSFLKPRIDTNSWPSFNSRPSYFIEKKTW